METIMGLCVGIGLAATCGFRVFVPLLGMSIASQAGHLELASGFEWIGSWPALITLSAASILEVAGYYIPWVDNLLDAIALPAAVIAGTVVTASMVGEVSPLLRWGLALIAGGAAAGAVQVVTTGARAASVAATGGLGNPIVSTVELGASLVGTVMALIVPIIAVLVGILLLVWIFRWAALKRKKSVPVVVDI